MAKVKYKHPPVGMARMVIKSDNNSRPSLGMTEVKGEIYYLSPDIIISYRNQARKDISEESLMELAASIQSQGIIQPLQVIPSLDNEGKFEVVSGERRLLAAKKIGFDTVPCMILDRDRDSDEIALIENIQREDLHPIELADAVSNLLKKKRYGSQTDIAEKIGVSKQQVSHLMAISRLPEDVKKHFIKKRDLKISFLRKMAYMKDEDSIREKVFKSSQDQKKYRSILRLSSNGNLLRFDYLKIDRLSPSEKTSLKDELFNLIHKLEV